MNQSNWNALQMSRSGRIITNTNRWRPAQEENVPQLSRKTADISKEDTNDPTKAALEPTLIDMSLPEEGIPEDISFSINHQSL